MCPRRRCGQEIKLLISLETVVRVGPTAGTSVSLGHHFSNSRDLPTPFWWAGFLFLRGFLC